MQKRRFDWRWVALIALVAIIMGGRQLPWPILLVALAGSGGYLLSLGWQSWGRKTGNSTRVTYWRGQRIEIAPERRRMLPSLQALAPVLVYFVIGSILLLSALVVLLQHVTDLG